MIELTSVEEGVEVWVRYDEIAIMARKNWPSTTIVNPDMAPVQTVLFMKNGQKYSVKETPIEIEEMARAEYDKWIGEDATVTSLGGVVNA